MSRADIGSETTTASSFEVIRDRRVEWQRRLDMVDDAREFLYQTLFYIEFDDYGRRMIEALTSAQRRGVRVQLIVDSFGQRLGGVLMPGPTRQALNRALDALRAAGAAVQFYRPPRIAQRWLAGGHHFKIQVSEAGEALLCSGNITKSSFEGWQECAVALRGAVVANLVESLASLGAVGVADVAGQLRNRFEAGAIPVDYWFFNPNDAQGPTGVFGRGWKNTLTDRMVEMVEQAQVSLAITSFYFKPTPVLGAAVEAAARRGVRVEVFHSHRRALPATALAWIASAGLFPRLLDAGVVIRELPDGEHSKIVLVDDEWVAIGSYNFEDAAHERLAEAMIATRYRPAVSAAAAIMDDLRRHPDISLVTAHSCEAWSPSLRRQVAVCRPFRRWL